MFSLFNRDLIKCNSTLSTGQREVLPDLWSLHDSYVQGRSNRNGALLHHGDLYLCSCHGRRWDSKSPHFIYVLPIFLLIVFSLYYCYCVIKLFVIFHFCSFRISFYREKSVSGCSSWRQKNTKTCTVWQWQDRASIATFSASMWFPNTLERIHPSWRRYELLFTSFVCYRYSNNAHNCSYKRPIQ